MTEFKRVIRSAAIAGSVAGTAFLIVHLSLNAIVHDLSPWFTFRAIGAIVLGKGVLPPPATFDLGIVLVALVVHYLLSVVYTTTGATIARPQPVPAILMGAMLGFLLYLVNFYIFTAFFQWFEGARNWISIVTHVVFGSVASLLYLKLRQRMNHRVSRLTADHAQTAGIDTSN